RAVGTLEPPAVSVQALEQCFAVLEKRPGDAHAAKFGQSEIRVAAAAIVPPCLRSLARGAGRLVGVVVAEAVRARAGGIGRPARAASRGRCSQKRTPGIFVCVVPYSPRMPSGAPGFGSNVSCCDGPPD